MNKISKLDTYQHIPIHPNITLLLFNACRKISPPKNIPFQVFNGDLPWFSSHQKSLQQCHHLDFTSLTARIDWQTNPPTKTPTTDEGPSQELGLDERLKKPKDFNYPPNAWEKNLSKWLVWLLLKNGIPNKPIYPPGNKYISQQTWLKSRQTFPGEVYRYFSVRKGRAFQWALCELLERNWWFAKLVSSQHIGGMYAHAGPSHWNVAPSGFFGFYQYVIPIQTQCNNEHTSIASDCKNWNSQANPTWARAVAAIFFLQLLTSNELGAGTQSLRSTFCLRIVPIPQPCHYLTCCCSLCQICPGFAATGTTRNPLNSKSSSMGFTAFPCFSSMPWTFGEALFGNLTFNEHPGGILTSVKKSD